MDLNLFDFDLDLTMMVFFMNAQEQVYARYGGRDAKDPDNRQSLAGLHYTMQSVLDMHGREDKEFAPKVHSVPRYLRDVSTSRQGRGCLHCHQVKEVLNRDLEKSDEWTREMVWRYPLPENIGLTLEVDRGNVVKQVEPKSPAAAAGVKPGEILRRLNNFPVHSFGEAQQALDRAPKAGSIDIVWQHDRETKQEKLLLPEDWRKTDLTWRPSMHRFLPAAGVYGTDLKADERKKLGLAENQLAFRQWERLTRQAKDAGVHANDIILGVDDKTLETDVTGFLRYVRRNYLAGDKVTLNVLRDGKRLNLLMTLGR